jgi:hypothetical protein
MTFHQFYGSVSVGSVVFGPPGSASGSIRQRYGSTELYKCVPVTGMFFSESGLVHPNYTEVHLPDIQAEAMDVMSKYVVCMFTVRKD